MTWHGVPCRGVGVSVGVGVGVGVVVVVGVGVAWRGVGSGFASHVTRFDFEECRGNAGRSAGGRGGKDNGGLQSRQKVFIRS